MARAGNTDRLSLIDRLYRFAGGLRSPGEVDIERPITVVHDVMPGVERASGAFFSTRTQSVTALASATEYDAYTRAEIMADARNVLAGKALTEFDDLWWIRTRIMLDPTDAFLASAYVGWNDGSTNDTGTIVMYANSHDAALQSGGERQAYETTGRIMNRPVDLFPILLPSRNQNVAIHAKLSSNASGTTTAYFTHTFWVGPAGSKPPPFKR